MKKEILSADNWNTNSDLIADVAALGFIRKEWTTLDPTYGKGNFWNKWQPDVLVGSDIDLELSPAGKSIDATNLPYADRSFDVVSLDPPFKQNGTSTGKGPASSDKAYGVHVAATRDSRLGLMLAMMDEGSRVADKRLLMKLQPQVVSGKKLWQDHIVWQHGESLGWRLLDQFYFLGRRKQPEKNIDGSDRRQVHSRTNYSSLMIFTRN